jgi:cyclase
MNAARITPCLDEKDGRVVNGINIENLRNAREPLEVAEAYRREGAAELEHLYEAVIVSKASAVPAASIFHFGETSIPEAKRYPKEKGMPPGIQGT